MLVFSHFDRIPTCAEQTADRRTQGRSRYCASKASRGKDVVIALYHYFSWDYAIMVNVFHLSPLKSSTMFSL